MRFAHFVISLHIIFGASQFTTLTTAQAAPMDAAQATELLAKSQAIDVKCSVLAANQSQDLKDLVARAEISLAEKASVSVARKTIASGRATGKSAICDDATKKMVKDVLAAASLAAAAPIEDMTTKEPEAQAATPAIKPVATEKPQNNAVAAAEPKPAPAPVVVKKTKIAKIAKLVAPVKVTPVKVAEVVKPVKPVKNAKPAKPVKNVKPDKVSKTVKPPKGLGTYAAVAEKYYVATRCGSMSSGKINVLYKNVLANHKQALASNRPQVVRAMLQSAEAKAGAKTCS
jgi:hypothetical protein